MLNPIYTPCLKSQGFWSQQDICLEGRKEGKTDIWTNVSTQRIFFLCLNVILWGIIEVWISIHFLSVINCCTTTTKAESWDTQEIKLWLSHDKNLFSSKFPCEETSLLLCCCALDGSYLESQCRMGKLLYRLSIYKSMTLMKGSNMTPSSYKLISIRASLLDRLIYNMASSNDETGTEIYLHIISWTDYTSLLAPRPCECACSCVCVGRLEQNPSAISF